MSDDLVSQQLSGQSIHAGQLEHNPNEISSSLPMDIVGHPALEQWPIPMSGSVTMDALTQQTSVRNGQTQPMEFMSNSDVSVASNMQMDQMISNTFSLDSQQCLLHNKQLEERGNMCYQAGPELSLTSTKRKEPMEPTDDSSLPQKLSVSNKRVAQMDNKPWLQKMYTPNFLTGQVQFFHNTVVKQRSRVPVRRPASIKRLSQQQPVHKSEARELQTSPEVQNGPFESVRSKLRESLAAALALVSQEQDKSSQIRKGASGESMSAKIQTQEDSQFSTEISGAQDVSEHASEVPADLAYAEDTTAQKFSNDQHFSTVGIDDSIEAVKPSRQEYQFSNIFHDEDIPFSENFFANDELLQGNGLSWVLESDALSQNIGIGSTQEQLSEDSFADRIRPQAVDSPEILASKIEAELFKLFGGVNKKYKEKGRSLIFNLKDRNNPDLRERVVLGEIPPERLCSMSAEELASKELSQWRMAKAEELAQMVILPDSDGDMRRLVKKTHKGEVQVDVDEQDAVSAEVAVGTSSTTQARATSEKEVSLHKSPSKTKDKAISSKKSTSASEQNMFTIPSNEGADLMQGLTVDDAFKDASFLPPIVSLDEFMASLNSEPPFEDLPADLGRSAVELQNKSSRDGCEVKSSVASPTVDGRVRSSKPESVDMADKSYIAEEKRDEGKKKLESKINVNLSSGEHFWDGSLQLNLSSKVPVIGIFKSGERTAAKDWPACVEIKGRVRLDAFNKFLQGLPMSRSRAFMVVHFACKEGSSESERASLCEVTDSYVLDERVGYAEPALGTELYLCPPHSTTHSMLTKVLQSGSVDALHSIDKGLIGVFVWRKLQSSSPNAHSHHKQHSKKQHQTSRGQHQEKDNVSVNAFTSKHPSERPLHVAMHLKPQPVVEEDDTDTDAHDDDVPPGFGPPLNQDEDDLPEFNFSSGSITVKPEFGVNRSTVSTFHQPHVASQSVDKIRELIQKYGQSETNSSFGSWKDKRGTGVAVRPWNNNDEDDDMPEWNPEETQHSSLRTNLASRVTMGAKLLKGSTHRPVTPRGSFPSMTVHPHSFHGTQMVPPSSPYATPAATYRHNGRQFQGRPQGNTWNMGVRKK